MVGDRRRQTRARTARSKELKYYEVGKSEDGKDGKAVSLAGLVTTRVPACRSGMKYLRKCGAAIATTSTSSNMHGYDWQKLRQKYEPLVGSSDIEPTSTT
jgi:hypothetical protein